MKAKPRSGPKLNEQDYLLLAESAPEALNYRKRCVPNDLELLDCLARGWTIREIATEFGKAMQNEYTHLCRVRDRMEARTTEHMIAIFMEHRGHAFDSRGYWTLPPSACGIPRVPQPPEPPPAAPELPRAA